MQVDLNLLLTVALGIAGIVGTAFTSVYVERLRGSNALREAKLIATSDAALQALTVIERAGQWVQLDGADILDSIAAEESGYPTGASRPRERPSDGELAMAKASLSVFGGRETRQLATSWQESFGAWTRQKEAWGWIWTENGENPAPSEVRGVLDAENGARSLLLEAVANQLSGGK